MAEAEGSSRQPVPEALQLHGSDHPGMILVSALLTKHNYLTWSYAVKRALRAKLKLGFIDGTCVKPHMTDPLFEHWVEKQREVHMDGADAIDNVAMQVRGGGRREFVPRSVQRKILTDKRSQYCNHCDRSGHTRETCFKLHGTPDWYKDLAEKKKKEGGTVRGYNVQMEDQQLQHKTHTQEALMQELIRLMKPEGHHMQLQEDPLQANFAQLDNFADVLYIPNFKYNLLSVPKLCSHSSIEVKFYSSYCVLQDLVTKRIIAIGKLFQNLYVLDKSSFSPSTIASFTAAHNKSCINSVSCNNVLWHRRLGHPSFNVLKHVPEVKSIDPTDICMICPLAKQSRLPFSTCAIQSKRVFELIHVDLWGPYRTQTYNGCNYFLTIVDDFSRATWTFLLRYKTQEPRSYPEASKDARWVAAMNDELSALDKNETWELVPLPPGKRAIGSKWVFKLKLNPDDVNNAFLHGHLDEEVYMVPPEGYSPAVSGHVCKLKRSLYGLKQASRQWNIELTAKLHEFGYIQCPHDHCLFLKATATCFVALLVYVDDILLTGNSEDEIIAVKGYLHSLFTIKDLGSAKYFLGLELARSAHGLLVTQQKYLTDILTDVTLLDAKVTSTPLPPGLHLTTATGSLLPDPGPYRRLIGRLLYLGFTRPDISFAVQQLSQFIQHPRSSHWDAAVHVLRYLKGTSALGLFFPSSNTLQPSVFTDASWASCPDSRRSTTGFCIFLGLLSYLGKQRSKRRFLVPPLKLNIVVWELRCVNSYGFPTCFVPFMFPSERLFRFGVTTTLPSILLPILCSRAHQAFGH
ncbi:UNVERIFIED_CONTAM: Retrovirus-related Pol polyprotein from transposon RE2 [Sesamum radiatum]|uniref:Retrovirus-related Pol polyprotein from transposon RE2 n=1 Tax=Sesamum radiatum TaxID=300843 RepID=A0AAW2P398_SESRA